MISLLTQAIYSRSRRYESERRTNKRVKAAKQALARDEKQFATLKDAKQRAQKKEKIAEKQKQVDALRSQLDEATATLEQLKTASETKAQAFRDTLENLNKELKNQTKTPR